MIAVQTNGLPNREHLSRLLDFYEEILAVCRHQVIMPVLSGSLAVFGYTGSQNMAINDIDLACSELAFPSLMQALEVRGLACTLKEWRVLQARRDELKIEFDSLEYWLKGLPPEYETLVVDGHIFTVVSFSSLKELYRRGVEATADQGDGAKYAAIMRKYEALCSIER